MGYNSRLLDDFDQYRRVFAKLQSCKEGHWYKKVPFRLYVVEVLDSLNLLLTSSQKPGVTPTVIEVNTIKSRYFIVLLCFECMFDDLPFHFVTCHPQELFHLLGFADTNQEPFAAVNLEGTPTILGDLLDYFLPDEEVTKVRRPLSPL